MKYLCIKECCQIDYTYLIMKRLFVVGKEYDFQTEPDSRFFRKVKTKQSER